MKRDEKASEIKFLLSFFSQQLEEQWRELPGEFKPTWLRVGQFETTPKNPIHFYLLLLVGLLDGSPSWFEESLTERLDEIRDLLFYWVLESPFDYVLERPELDRDGVFVPRDRDGIWRVIARLCSEALTYESLRCSTTQGISLEYLLHKYCTPPDVDNTENDS